MKKIGILAIGALFFVSCKKEDKTESTDTFVIETGINGTFDIDSTSTIEWIGSKPSGKHNGKITVKNGEFTIESGKIT